ncbi:MAG: ComF family protein [Patescibacteria group bacterium]
MKGGFFVFVKFVKDLFFPIFCAKCGREGEWLCENCLGKIETAKVNFDSVDLAGTDLDGLFYLFYYNDQDFIAKLIRGFKYGYAREMAEIWKSFILKCDLVSGFTIVPVPLHPRRQRERGFNQSQILAELLAEVFDLPIENKGLVRVRNTVQQAKLSGEQRKNNVKDAFAWKSADAPPQNVLLVDDVYTTGATMAQCAKVLKQNGANKVRGFVLAKSG